MNLFLRSQQLKRWLVDQQSIMRIRNTECLTNSSGTGTKEPFLIQSASDSYDLQPGDWFECANQNARAMPFRLADEIQAPMNPIRTIYICPAGRAEHYFIPLGWTGEAM